MHNYNFTPFGGDGETKGGWLVTRIGMYLIHIHRMMDGTPVPSIDGAHRVLSRSMLRCKQGYPAADIPKSIKMS